MTAFNVKAIVVYLLTLAPVNAADKLRSLWGRFGRLKRVSIRFSSKSSNKHQAINLW